MATRQQLAAHCRILQQAYAFKILHLESVADQPVRQLSVGQRQLVSIARALAGQPDVVLLDEPASALDPISTQAIEDLMDELKHNYTLVIVTHDSSVARRAQRTAIMQNGLLTIRDPTAVPQATA